ncbi:MAG TPA: alpha/beta hydrolase, partial [Stenomitos sp.]
IASAPVVGHSYGGWVALNIALFAPERVDRLVLLAPAASFMPLNPQFGLRLMLMAMLRNRWSAMSFGRWTTKKGNEPPHELYDQFHQGIKHFRWGPILRPTVFTDAELSRIRTPTLLLIGDHEVILDWRAAIRRAQALLPDVQVEVIADAAHVLITEQPDRLNRQVLAFLKD